MAYGVKEDKTKANIVELTHTFNGGASSGMREKTYTGAWQELEALGVDPDDFAAGKWAILSCYEDYPFPPNTDHLYRCGGSIPGSDSEVAYPNVVFRPKYSTPSFVITTFYGWTEEDTITVHVILMKIA